METDRNLLFAVLALQTDFLTREQFVDACTLWAGRKHESLAELVVSQGWLSHEDRALVDSLLQRKLKQHGDVKAALESLYTPGVQASLAEVSGLQESASGALPELRRLGPMPTTSPGEPGSRYTLSRLHASGGIGQVWLARDETLGREVALKELRPDRLTHPAVWARFLREAKVTGQLEHPGIVPVHELGAGEQGEPFYTMRFVRGRTLAEAVAAYHERRLAGERQPVRFRDLLGACESICQAVAFAHSRGVIHRDLKPQNVVLGDFGEVIVLDWGLARLFEQPDDPAAATVDETPTQMPGDELATAAGQVLGTPAYMAPEQAAGRTVGPLADVYGLGAILYEVLAGKPPFTGSSTDDILQRVCNSAPVSPRQRNPQVPRPLEAICQKCLAKRPEDRYPSASDLAEDLRRYLADEPVAAYPEPIWLRARRWARHHRPLVAGGSTAIVLLSLSLATFWVWRDRARRAELAELERQETAASVAASAGDIDVAIALYQVLEERGLAAGSNSFQVRAENRRRSLERLRDFRSLSRTALKEGTHNVRSKGDDGGLLRTCEQSLAIFDLADPRFDPEQLRDALSEREVQEVLSTGHDLLILTAIRLALYDTRDEASQRATRKGLQLLERAEAIGTHIDREVSTGEWMLRMLWNRRVGENALANQAGENMTRNAKEQRSLKHARDYYLLGSITLQLLKKPQEALSQYRRALRLESTHYGALFGTYLCNVELKNIPGEIAALSACIALRPEVADLFYFRGYAYFRQANYEAAHVDFDTAATVDPRHQNGHYFRGRTYVMTGKWAEAEKDFDQALRLGPSSGTLLTWRGLARAKLGRAHHAAEDARNALANPAVSMEEMIRVARTFAQASKAEQSAEQASKYQDECLAVLQQVLSKGFTDLGSFGPGSDFDPVRSRPEFQEMLRKASSSKKGDD